MGIVKNVKKSSTKPAGKNDKSKSKKIDKPASKKPIITGGRNEWGHHFGSKAEIIDSIILKSKTPLTTAEIQVIADKACKDIGGCGMIRLSAHLQHCRRNEMIEKAANGGWQAVTKKGKKAAK